MKWKHFSRYWPVPGEFPEQRPVTRSFDFPDLRLNKRLSKQSRGWWFETPRHRAHYDVIVMQWNMKPGSHFRDHHLVTLPCSHTSANSIGLIHKSQNAPVPYPTNALFRTEMCTFLFWMEHFGIWNRCILGFMTFVYWRSGSCRWNRSPHKLSWPDLQIRLQDKIPDSGHRDERSHSDMEEL